MIYRRNTRIYSKKIEKTWYILDRGKKYVRELNEVAGDIWEFLEKPREKEDIIRHIASHYRADNTIIERDVRLFLTRYVKDGLIEKTDPPTKPRA